MDRAGSLRWVFVVCVSLLALGCTAPGGPESAVSWKPDAGPAERTEVSTTCTPARASEDLGARIDVLAAIGKGPMAVAGTRVVQVTELFDRFNTICGRCHVATANGGRQLSATTFAMGFDQTWLARIISEDPAMAMPPEGKAYSSRPDRDPVHQLANLLEPWLAQGRPADMFTVSDGSATGSSGGLAGYAYSAMTNLGDCIPDPTQYAASPSTEMESKDEFFANATGLPGNLAETDLTTFDADTLAANGVIAFVPAYPLWSDGSGKLRHIRVPKGTTVAFNKATQTFDIPPNTRFYKTFFRKVLDGAGRPSNRKMETRLIVARPDTLESDGTTPHPNGLFGTYIWSEDEMTATLLDVPYRDGTGFADRTAEYVTNEAEYHDVLESIGPGAEHPAFSDRFKSELSRHPGLVQHYAVPGSLRCVQCHRGSPAHNFVLGFLPLQIAQRPSATGGKYEPAGADEVNQLQRLIDYGVISGMTSPADVVPLENSQLPRHFRTPQELAAQAYMVGNCMHCHNPRGYPSLAKPELATALNFMPGTGADGGGIFEFSLERMSPVRARGANQDVPIPYITPSLRDIPVADDVSFRVDNNSFIGFGGEPPPEHQISEITWTPKYSPEMEKGNIRCGDSLPNGFTAYCGARKTGHSFVAAPWRSLIYRNVDTPFPYFDDYVPFPHMPMNSPGFDCRAPRIMGDWMVSLPAFRKNTTASEDALPIHDSTAPFDSSPQPYVEVKPSDSRYGSAITAATLRMAEYHAGVRYQYCEDVLSPDILDPVPTQTTYHPDPTRYLAGGIPPEDPNQPGRYVQPAIGVPYHSEWFNYDPTDSPPPWQPRRGSVWYDILVKQIPDVSIPAGQDHLTAPPLLENDVDNRRRVVAAVNQAELTDPLRKYATTEVPFGLWQVKPGCESKLAGMPKVRDFSGSARPLWMDAGVTPPASDAPVFMMSPGASLYRHICFNCHGPKADGKGLQGDALAASSEGEARPANFMTGLFGPPENPGQNLLDVFGGVGGASHDIKTAVTWASRYMAWMTLGGTLQLIPKDVIHQVEATRILGLPRPNVAVSLKGVGGASANMLNLAKGLCSVVLPDQTGYGLRAEPFSDGASPAGGYPPLKSATAPFVLSNGDWELWMNLCSRYNPPVVRVYGFSGGELKDVVLQALYYGDSYPASTPILDHNQLIQMGVQPGNYYPACLADPSALPVPALSLQKFQINSKNMPICPKDFLNTAPVMWRLEDDNDPDQIDNVKEWMLRGAINAGMSVFSYLQSADLAHTKIKPYYNECQLLP